MSRLVYVQDDNSQKFFLVDSGAAISVLPCSSTKGVTSRLLAANGTEIPTFGCTKRWLSLGSRPFLWTFTLARVETPILGADFLDHFSLSLNVRDLTLTDPQGRTIKLHRMELERKMATIEVAQFCFENIARKFKIKETTFDQKHGTHHHIETTQERSIYAVPRPLDKEKLFEAKKVFKEMMEKGVIRRSNSPWASPLHMVKKSNGSWRPCGDYRRLNAITIPDRYPLPRIQDVTANLKGTNIYTKLDLVKGYYQIPMAPSDIQKTAVCTPFGLYEFLRMPFGLKNAAQTFQRLMDTLFNDFPWVYTYLDDILIASSTKKDHKVHVEQVCRKLEEAGMVINFEKSQFGRKNINFLGHEIDATGIRPLQSKVDAILNLKEPETLSELQKFIGMTTFYIRFIPELAKHLAPLHDIKATNKKAKIRLTETQKTAIQNTKKAVANATKLAYPDAAAEIHIFVDASNEGIGGAIQQGKETIKPIAFYSRKLSEVEQRYSTYDRELLAIYDIVKHFRHYLEGKNCIIYTDHKPLTTAITKNKDSLTSKQQRQISFISQFTTDVRHVPGKNNLMADALSRSINKITLLSTKRLEEEQSKEVSMEKQYSMMKNGCKLYTDKHHRVWVPQNLTYQIFQQFHDLSHNSARSTKKLIKQSYIWPNMNTDINKWCKNCTNCQKSKIGRYTRTETDKIMIPDLKFEHIHVDLVGPLPPSEGYKYLLTILDRTTRWPVAIPLRSITTEKVLKALKFHWFANYGLPTRMTADNGGQFISQKFGQTMKELGIDLIHTSGYHPQSNGILERFHRTLKSSLKAHNDTDWLNNLPWVMLGLRTALKNDSNLTSAELVYQQQVKEF